MAEERRRGVEGVFSQVLVGGRAGGVPESLLGHSPLMRTPPSWPNCLLRATQLHPTGDSVSAENWGGLKCFLCSIAQSCLLREASLASEAQAPLCFSFLILPQRYVLTHIERGREGAGEKSIYMREEHLPVASRKHPSQGLNPQPGACCGMEPCMAALPPGSAPALPHGSTLQLPVACPSSKNGSPLHGHRKWTVSHILFISSGIEQSK